MRLLSLLLLAALASFSCVSGHSAAVPRQLRLLAPDRYLPSLPVLVRVEVTDTNGQRDWTVWDAEALLSVDLPGVVLSTNRVVLRNGLGSALVSFSNGGDFNLIATFGALQTNRLLHTATNLPMTSVGGILPGAATTWADVVLVTSDVIVLPGHILTIQSNTIVLLSGVTGGTVANDISVSGTILSLGTEAHPVTITCADSGLQYRWGQIRHNNAQPSLYQHTTITRGGRSTGEGHTGTAPIIRCTGSRITFESCNITDVSEWSHASPEFGGPGKILQSSFGSDITFNNCLLARARMGPEISETALLLTNSYIVEMYGTNDSDGLFLDPQQPGQAVKISGSVLADGEDDGIDTFGSTLTIENSIVRNWRNPLEDSKGISFEGGELTVRHCLLIDNALGISGKGNNGISVRLHVNQSTILSPSYAIGATNKNGTTPLIDYRITNSILRGVSDSVFTQYNPANIRLYYCNVGEPWTGIGCNFADPMFVDAANHDYRLRPYSVAIDAGAPSEPEDFDGTASDIGYFTFVAPPPWLTIPEVPSNGTFRFSLNAYPNRDYEIQVTTNLVSWTPLTTISQTNPSGPVADAAGTNAPSRYYRAQLIPKP